MERKEWPKALKESRKKSAPSSVCAFTNSCILYPLYLSPTTQTPITLIVRGSHVHVRGCVIIICLVHATFCRPCRLFQLQRPFWKRLRQLRDGVCLLIFEMLSHFGFARSSFTPLFDTAAQPNSPRTTTPPNPATYSYVKLIHILRHANFRLQSIVGCFCHCIEKLGYIHLFCKCTMRNTWLWKTCISFILIQWAPQTLSVVYKRYLGIFDTVLVSLRTHTDLQT